MKVKILIVLSVLLCALIGSYSEAAGEPLKKGDAAPDFEISTVSGRTLKLAHFKNYTPLIIDLWATWCPPCQKEMPELQKLYNKYAGQFDIIAVSVDEKTDAQKVKDFIEKNKIAFYVAHDTEKKISGKYVTDSIPYLVIIGKDGIILGTITGYSKNLEKELVDALNLKEPKTAADFAERGYAFYDMRSDLDKAFDDFNKAVKMDSSNSSAICGRGEIYLEKKELDKAKQDLDKALQLDQKNVRAWFNRGMAEEKVRKYNEAMDFYNKGLEANPGDANLQYFKEKLESKLAVIGKPAPDIEVTTINGEKLKMSDYKGKKAVIVDCWATWCGPCRMEMPKLQEFYLKHSDDVEIIAISGEKDGDTKVPEFIKAQGFTFKVVYDAERKAYDKFPTKGIPFVTIISKDGIILDTFTGYDPNVIEELEDLLKL